MVEGDFGDAEGAESIGFSHGELGLVVKALDDAAGELFSSAEIIDDEYMSEQTNLMPSASGLPIMVKNCSKLATVRSLPIHNRRVQPCSIW